MIGIYRWKSKFLVRIKNSYYRLNTKIVAALSHSAMREEFEDRNKMKKLI